MTSTKAPQRSPDGGRRSRALLILIGFVVVGFGLAWIVRANQVTTEVEHPGKTGAGAVSIDSGDTSPLVITVAPARRSEGASVEINGVAVAHPPGERPGQLAVDLSKLSPGLSEVVVRVPRPTWFEAVTTVSIEVVN